MDQINLSPLVDQILLALGHISNTIMPPFDLAAIRTICSPEAKSHTSILSPSTTEEQRREGLHPREKRVKLVV
jgi:hypothetical protein